MEKSEVHTEPLWELLWTFEGEENLPLLFLLHISAVDECCQLLLSFVSNFSWSRPSMTISGMWSLTHLKTICLQLMQLCKGFKSMASTDSLKKGEQRSIIVMSIHFLIFLQRKNNISGTCDMRMLTSKNAVLTSVVLAIDCEISR